MKGACNMADVSELVNQFAASATTRRDQLKASIGSAPTFEQRLGIAFNRGDRVFDTLTGKEGIVENAAVTHTVVSSPAIGDTSSHPSEA